MRDMTSQYSLPSSMPTVRHQYRSYVRTNDTGRVDSLLLRRNVVGKLGVFSSSSEAFAHKLVQFLFGYFDSVLSSPLDQLNILAALLVSKRSRLVCFDFSPASSPKSDRSYLQGEKKLKKNEVSLVGKVADFSSLKIIHIVQEIRTRTSLPSFLQVNSTFLCVKKHITDAQIQQSKPIDPSDKSVRPTVLGRRRSTLENE